MEIYTETQYQQAVEQYKELHAAIGEYEESIRPKTTFADRLQYFFKVLSFGLVVIYGCGAVVGACLYLYNEELIKHLLDLAKWVWISAVGAALLLSLLGINHKTELL